MPRKGYLQLRVSVEEKAALSYLARLLGLTLPETLRQLIREEASRRGVYVGYARLFEAIEKAKTEGQA